MKGKKTVDRKGYSLVEMLIVIALLGILVGGIGLSIGLLRSTDTKGTAYDINSGLTDLKSRTTGGKDQPYMYLYSINNTYYMDITYIEPSAYTPTTDAKEIGDNRVQITYGTDKKNIEDAADGFICLAFQKKDGAFLKDEDGNCLKDGKNTCPEVVYVSADDASAYVIHMVPDTGHHYIEEE